MWWTKKRATNVPAVLEVPVTLVVQRPIRWRDRVVIKIGFFEGIVGEAMDVHKCWDGAEDILVHWHYNGKFSCKHFKQEELELTNKELTK